MRKVDVLVVGAGPVGLVMALRLARQNLSVAVVESSDAPQSDLRASTFHPPTLDMLDEDGITPELLAQGLKAPNWQIRMHATGEVAQFELSILKDDTAHPYRLQCEQSKLVRVLLTKLQTSYASLVQVHYGTLAEQFQQDESGVTLTCAKGEEKFDLHGKYLVGADGSRSVVRKSVGLEFVGETFPETTILSTTTFQFQDHIPNLAHINYCWSENGTFSLLKLPGQWRVSLYAEEGETTEQALEHESIQRKLQVICPQAEPYPIGQTRAYRIHQRVVPGYRVGRVFLAGDAAHINSPSGGMGMNGGIHDAFNLADKIGKVIKGDSEDLLDLYERQRRPVALDDVLAQSGRNRARMQERDMTKRLVALRELQAVANDPARAHQYLLQSSMIAGLRKAAAIR